jgi:hypothetical protein
LPPPPPPPEIPQAAAVEVGTSLVNTVSGGPKDSKSGGGDQSNKQGPMPEPLKMVGGIGMELLRVSDRAAAAAGPAAAAAVAAVLQNWYQPC